MIVTDRDIRARLADLLSGEADREEVADYAASAIAADDAGRLVMQPPEQEKKIWRALTYLTGADVKDAPDEYLHSVDDFRAFAASLDL